MKIKDNFARILLIAAFFAFGTSTLPAQTRVVIERMNSAALSVQNLKLESKLMARSMPYRVLLPNGYDANKSERYAVIYLLHGLTGHFDNWTDKTDLKNYAAGYNYIIVTPEGDNGWYTDSATAPTEKYESYLVKELIPEIDKNYRTLADRRHRAIAGLSMGGYGSLKFGLKYPEMFALVGSFSGALPAASWTDKNLGNNWKALSDSIMSIYGADGSETRANNDIFKIVKDASPEKIKTMPFIFQSCGTEDFLIQTNHDFAAALFEKKIPHEYREHPGIHDWKFWDDQIREFLQTSGTYLK